MRTKTLYLLATTFLCTALFFNDVLASERPLVSAREADAPPAPQIHKALEHLSSEIIHFTMGFMDTQTRVALGATSRAFRTHATDDVILRHARLSDITKKINRESLAEFSALIANAEVLNLGRQNAQFLLSRIGTFAFDSIDSFKTFIRLYREQLHPDHQFSLKFKNESDLHDYFPASHGVRAMWGDMNSTDLEDFLSFNCGGLLLRTLDFSASGFVDACIDPLMRFLTAPGCPVKNLYLGYNAINTDALRRLVAALQATSLTHLSLSQIGQGSGGIDLPVFGDLATHLPQSKIKALELYQVEMNDDKLVTLLPALRYNTIEELSMGYNPAITPTGLRAFFVGITQNQSCLHTLNMLYTPFSLEMIKVVGDSLPISIRSLNLIGVGLTKESLAPLVTAIEQGMPLEQLLLGHNPIGDVAGCALAAAAAGSPLRILDLTGTNVGSHTAFTLAGILCAGSPLTTLSLEHNNNIKDREALALVRASTHSGLTHLNLDETSIGRDDVNRREAIAEVAQGYVGVMPPVVDLPPILAELAEQVAAINTARELTITPPLTLSIDSTWLRGLTTRLAEQQRRTDR